MMSDIINFLIGGFIMAFISEKILDEDLKYFLTFGFRDPWNNIITPDWWVIDREKNIFLFCRNGQGNKDIPLLFGLFINNSVVKIETVKKTEGDRFDKNLVIHWFINKITIPFSLIVNGYNKNNIKQLVVEAFYAMGTMGLERSKIIDVIIERIADPDLNNE
jgi:hypothetical protein